MPQKEIGYLVIIRGRNLKRKMTFYRKAKSILEQAEQVMRGMYYFPIQSYMPPDIPKKVAEKYKIKVEASDMVKALVEIALEHGAKYNVKEEKSDIICYSALPFALTSLIPKLQPKKKNS
jgi:hypothetical protein